MAGNPAGRGSAALAGQLGKVVGSSPTYPQRMVHAFFKAEGGRREGQLVSATGRAAQSEFGWNPTIMGSNPASWLFPAHVFASSAGGKVLVRERPFSAQRSWVRTRPIPCVFSMPEPSSKLLDEAIPFSFDYRVLKIL